jgi:hypothetical protein
VAADHADDADVKSDNPCEPADHADDADEKSVISVQRRASDVEERLFARRLGGGKMLLRLGANIVNA